MPKINSNLIIDASEVSILLNCSRGKVERLQLKGLLSPVSTIYPRYYFNKNEVIKLKESITSKKVVQ